MKSRPARPLLAVVLVSLAGLSAGTAPADKGWSDFGGGPAASHFLDLDQINKANVNQLEAAWFYPYAAAGFNPIVVDDVMYVLGRNNALIALDAATGKEIWIHERLNGITSRGLN